MHNNFYICFTNKEKIKTEQIDLAIHYWELDNNPKNIKHRYKVNELVKIFNYKTTTELSSEIRQLTFIGFNCKNTKCPSCGKPSIINTRTDHLKLVRQSDPTECPECKKDHLNAELAEILSSLEKIKIDSKFPEISQSTVQELSYLTKTIFLSWLLDKEFKPYEKINLTREEVNLTGSDSFDEKVLTELLQLNIIHLVQEDELNQLPALKYGRALINRNYYDLYPSLIAEFESNSQKIPKPGLYIILPHELKNMEDYIAHLQNEVLNAQLSSTDLQAIEDLVINNRLDVSYLLLNEAKNKHKIPVDENTKLDSVLTKLIREYPIKVAFNIINYQAKLTAADLYSQPSMPSYIQSKILCKKIEEYMNYLEKNNKSTYEINIPNTVIGSSIEYFSSYFIMGELVSWTELSGNEIISKWINSPTLKISE